VFNCDETGWSGKECAREKVIGPKSGHIYQQNVMSNDHVTAHLCVSADGTFIPTMIIYKGCMPHRNYKDGLPGKKKFQFQFYNHGQPILVNVNSSAVHTWRK
jgi:hypothetical protein